MHTEKVAVTIPADLLEHARAAVAAGRARSVSAYVSRAVEEFRQRESLADFLAAWTAESGEPSAADYAWADAALQ